MRLDDNQTELLAQEESRRNAMTNGYNIPVATGSQCRSGSHLSSKADTLLTRGETATAELRSGGYDDE